MIEILAALQLMAFLLATDAEPDAQERWVDVPPDSVSWMHDGVSAEVVEHLGRRSLFLRNGLLQLSDVELRNGVIEFDIACSNRRGFVGAAWRIQDSSNLEYFYLRPHRSGMPDSCQYTPRYFGGSAWQLLPECAATVEFGVDRWMKVRLVLWEDVLQVFIDSDVPCLVARMRRPKSSGGIGLQVPGFAPAHFSKFRYRPLYERPSLNPLPAVKRPRGVVGEWEVSDAFPEAALSGRVSLPEELVSAREWSSLSAAPNGVTNLAQLQPATADANTCFARLRLSSESERTQSIRFGFSDRVRVFHRSVLVYEGDDGYQTRDHRFLGTIGLYDKVTLRLKPGANDVYFAVSESFGGWGILAALEEAAGAALR